MNERIKELMNQAAKQYYADTGEIKPNDMMYIFAELIVRECTKVCNDVGVAIFAEPVQNNFGTAQTCKLAIEKHFGVK